MHEDLGQLETELAGALKGLDTSQTQLHPQGNADKWNIQQITEHLLMSYERTCDVMNERLQKGRATRTRPTLAQRAGQFAVIRLGRFPTGREAPSAVMPGAPTSLQNGDELRRKLHEGLVEMDEAAGAAEKLFGSGRCVSHIILGPLAIAQWRRFHLVHGRHHITQIRQIRQDHSM